MFADLFKYIWQKKAWWLVPPVIVLFLFSIGLLLHAISPVTPFMYVLL